MHPIRSIGSLVAMLAMAGCASTTPASVSAPSPSVIPSEIVAAEPSTTPIPSVGPTVVATATPLSHEPGSTFGWDQLLLATGDGLAVRRAPTTSAGLVFAAYWDAQSEQWVGSSDEVRLSAGHRVRVSLGPIEREGITWYRVYNVPQRGQESPEEVAWDADNDDTYGVPLGDHGWIATTLDTQSFVAPVADPDPSNMNPPLIFASGGSGEFVSDKFVASMQVAGDWALGTGPLAPCDLTISLEPIGAMLVSTSLIGAFEGGEILSSPELDSAEYRIRVTAGVPDHPEAECTWAIYVGQVIG